MRNNINKVRVINNWNKSLVKNEIERFSQDTTGKYLVVSTIGLSAEIHETRITVLGCVLKSFIANLLSQGYDIIEITKLIEVEEVEEVEETQEYKVPTLNDIITNRTFSVTEEINKYKKNRTTTNIECNHFSQLQPEFYTYLSDYARTTKRLLWISNMSLEELCFLHMKYDVNLKDNSTETVTIKLTDDLDLFVDYEYYIYDDGYAVEVNDIYIWSTTLWSKINLK